MRVLGAMWREFRHEIVSKAKLLLLMAAAGGVLAFGARSATQLYAEANYALATATVVEAGWACPGRAGEPKRACSAAEAESANDAEPGTASFLMKVSFADGSGRIHARRMKTAWTGLDFRTALPGARFELLYDPANPANVSERFGAEPYSTFGAGVGVLILIGALVLWRRKRKAKTPEPAPVGSGPVFTRDGRRIRPLA